MSLMSKVKDAAVAVVAPMAEKLAEKLEEALTPSAPEATAAAPEAPRPAEKAPVVTGARKLAAPVAARVAKVETTPSVKVKRGQKHRHSHRR
jgi:hypothetical protein